nr:hypothetical protein [Actinomycetota bacterium]
MQEAQELLGEDAPWHQVATVAHGLEEEEEAEEDDSLPGVLWTKEDADKITLMFDPDRRREDRPGGLEELVMPIDEAKTLFRSLGITLVIAGHELPDIPSTLYAEEEDEDD